MVAAIAAFTIWIDLCVTNLHHAAAARMQYASVGDHPCADVMIDDDLNDVMAATGCAIQRFCHRPGTDIMLNINR
ncbi:hypothetical protein D3C81_2235570 [compost metagenome]